MNVPLVKEYDLDNYETSTVLNKAMVKGFPRQECCIQSYSKSACQSGQITIHDSVLCAGNATHEIGVCRGDSGGPLTFYNGTHHIVTGVTSYAWMPCGSFGVVDGFARVAR